MSVFSGISPRQFGHFAGAPEGNQSRSVRAGELIEDVIKRNLGAVWIAALTGLDQLLGFRKKHAS
jgi:hypothetical protein